MMQEDSQNERCFEELIEQSPVVFELYDGIGFDAQAIAWRHGSQGTFGLFSIRERMSDLDGSLEIESEPGAGTTATLIVPRDHLTGSPQTRNQRL